MEILLPLIAFAPVFTYAAPKLDKACCGSETVQAGKSRAPRTLPYALTFHAVPIAMVIARRPMPRRSDWPMFPGLPGNA